MQLLASEGGEVEVQAAGGLFGIRASIDAVAAPSDGKLVVHPVGALLSGLQLTLFSDPHVYVQGVGASVRTLRALELSADDEREPSLRPATRGRGRAGRSSARRSQAAADRSACGAVARRLTSTGSPCLGLIVGIWRMVS